MQGWAKKICELGARTPKRRPFGSSPNRTEERLSLLGHLAAAIATAIHEHRVAHGNSQTHEKPGENQSQTEHKKHYRTLFRRDFDLGFPGVAALYNKTCIPKSRLNGCRLMSKPPSLAVTNSRWITNSLNRSERQLIEDEEASEQPSRERTFAGSNQLVGRAK